MLLNTFKCFFITVNKLIIARQAIKKLRSIIQSKVFKILFTDRRTDFIVEKCVLL